MLEETGIITEKKGIFVKVKLKKTDACIGCQKCSFNKDDGYMNADAIDRIGASVGDTVTIKSLDISKAKAGLIIYILPLLLFIPGYLIGQGLSGIFITSVKFQQLIHVFGFLTGILFFAIPFVILKFLKTKKDSGLAIEIVSIKNKS